MEFVVRSASWVREAINRRLAVAADLHGHIRATVVGFIRHRRLDIRSSLNTI